MLATLVPPAKTIGYVVGAIGRFVVGARTDEIGETVVVRSTRTSGSGRFEIAEATPCDGDVVRSSFDIEIAVATVLEVAMIDPYVGGFVQTEVVPPVAVVGARSFERKVAQQQVTALQIQDTGLVFVLLVGNQFFARQRHNSQVGLVRADMVCNGDILRDNNHAVAFAQRGDQFALGLNQRRRSIASAGDRRSGVSPRGGSTVVNGV